MADPATVSDSIVQLLGYKAFSMVEFILKYQIMHVVVGVTSGVLTARFARKALERGQESKYRTPCTGTKYTNLGNGLRLQQIRKEADTVDLRDIFDKKYSSEIIKYIDQAAQLCSVERPYVLEHLYKVVPPEHHDRIMEQISRDVYGHYAPNDGVDEGIQNETFDEERQVYYLLVFEPTAQKKQYRFVTIDETMLEQDAMPNFENVVVEDRGQLLRAQDHYHGDRWHTNMALIRGINLDIDRVYSEFKFGIKTGNKLDIKQHHFYGKKSEPVLEKGDNVIPFPTLEAA